MINDKKFDCQEMMSSHTELLLFAKRIQAIYENKTALSLAGLFELTYHLSDNNPSSVAAMIVRAEKMITEREDDKSI